MTGPHVMQLDRDRLDDFGLVGADPAGVDDDDEKRRAPAATGALQKNHPLDQEQES